jgi:hypothetical protein
MHLRPRQVGYRLPYDPRSLRDHDEKRNGVRAGLEPDLEGHNLLCWPLHYPHSRTW